MLAHGFTSLFDGKKTRADVAPLNSTGGFFIKKVGIEKARDIMKNLAGSPGATPGSFIARAVLDGLSACKSDADRQSLISLAFSRIQGHPEASDRERALAAAADGTSTAFPPGTSEKALEVLSNTLSVARDESQGRSVAGLFEALEPVIPHDSGGRAFLGEGFRRIASGDSFSSEQRKAAEEGMAIAAQQDLDDKAAIEKMAELFASMKNLPGNDREREALELQEALRGGSRTTPFEVEDTELFIDGFRLSRQSD